MRKALLTGILLCLICNGWGCIFGPEFADAPAVIDSFEDTGEETDDTEVADGSVDAGGDMPPTDGGADMPGDDVGIDASDMPADMLVDMPVDMSVDMSFDSGVDMVTADTGVDMTTMDTGTDMTTTDTGTDMTTTDTGTDMTTTDTGTDMTTTDTGTDMSTTDMSTSDTGTDMSTISSGMECLPTTLPADDATCDVVRQTGCASGFFCKLFARFNPFRLEPECAVIEMTGTYTGTSGDICDASLNNNGGCAFGYECHQQTGVCRKVCLEDGALGCEATEYCRPIPEAAGYGHCRSSCN